MRKAFSLIAACGLLVSAFTACDDDVSKIGNSLVTGEVVITVDSARHKLQSKTVYDPSFDARTQTLMLGNINARQYGSLRCSFASRLMPVAALNYPDSLGEDRIDSLRLVVYATRGNLTGDSLLPQQMSIFRLLKSLPQNITASTDLSGYYDPDKPMARLNYTLSKMHLNDTAFYKGTTLRLSAKLPTEWGRQIYQAYKKDNSVFQWPASFEKKFHGLYFQQTFGSGCVANFNQVAFMLYYHRLATKNTVVDGENKPVQVHVADSCAVFATAPEVLSANLVKYSPGEFVNNLVADGKSIITTPGGYVTRFTFPLQEILDKYYEKDFNLSVVGNLSFEIPATKVEGDLSLGIPPYLLMIKTSEVKSFFESNLVPDNKTSFWAKYDGTRGCYRFATLRNYLLDAISKGKDAKPDDCDYTLIPVSIISEDYTDPYTRLKTTRVLVCTPYMGAPSMAELDMDNAMICLTFTNQVIE